MAQNSIISPRQPWVNKDGTPNSEFYKMVAKIPGIQTPPVVKGSKGGNVALASLIAALVSLGVIADQTS